MTVYDERPWLSLYDEGLPGDIELEHENALEMFKASVGRAAERPAIHYFGATLSWSDVDRLSDGLDVAFLTYTSGTTGPPKGAMNTHGNVVFNAQTYRDWMSLGEDDVVLGVAPLFHITGLIGHIALSMLVPIPMVLFYRFDSGVALEL